MAETPNVCHSLHMPLQSGSDEVLKAMRRSYRSEHYLGIIDKVRAAMPDAAITTDIIVGFPGETEDDFAAHPRRGPAGPVLHRLHLPVLASAPAPRPPPWTDQLPKQVVQERYERLIAVRRGDHLGGEQEAGRRDGRGAGRGRRGPQGRAHRPDVRPGPRRPAGALRDRRPRLTRHTRPARWLRWPASPAAVSGARRGRRVQRSGPATSSQTVITYAAPHHLNADGAPLSHRRTRAGDAFAQASAAGTTRTPAVPSGLPTLGPPPTPAAAGPGRSPTPCVDQGLSRLFDLCGYG